MEYAGQLSQCAAAWLLRTACAVEAELRDLCVQTPKGRVGPLAGERLPHREVQLWVIGGDCELLCASVCSAQVQRRVQGEGHCRITAKISPAPLAGAAT